MGQGHQPAALDLGELRGPLTNASRSSSHRSRGRPIDRRAGPGGMNLPPQNNRSSRGGLAGDGGRAPSGGLRPTPRAFDPEILRGQAANPSRSANRSSRHHNIHNNIPPADGLRSPPLAFNPGIPRDRAMNSPRSVSRSNHGSRHGPPNGMDGGMPPARDHAQGGRRSRHVDDSASSAGAEGYGRHHSRRPGSRGSDRRIVSGGFGDVYHDAYRPQPRD